MDHGERAKPASGCFVLPDGTLIWLEDGLYHRDGAPAVVHADGSTEWWSHGWLHRDEGPAVVGPGERREWWENGRPTWPDGEPLAAADVLLDDRSCLGVDLQSSDTSPTTIDLRDRRGSRRPWRRSQDA